MATTDSPNDHITRFFKDLWYLISRFPAVPPRGPTAPLLLLLKSLVTADQPNLACRTQVAWRTQYDGSSFSRTRWANPTTI
jgi:hypothetical protein